MKAQNTRTALFSTKSQPAAELRHACEFDVKAKVLPVASELDIAAAPDQRLGTMRLTT